jgi:putative transcriptional regulator
MATISLHKGKLLIAQPTNIFDENFSKSIILLTEHNQVGSIGFVLNKPLAYTLHDLIPEIHANFTIYNGGPVEQDNLYFIHNIPKLIPNSIEITYGLYWGGDFEITKNLINNGKINKSNIRFFLGYSGWDPKQLQDEIENSSWIVSNNSKKEAILSESSEHFWKEFILEIGGEFTYFANAPENPNLN